MNTETFTVITPLTGNRHARLRRAAAGLEAFTQPELVTRWLLGPADDGGLRLVSAGRIATCGTKDNGTEMGMGGISGDRRARTDRANQKFDNPWYEAKRSAPRC